MQTGRVSTDTEWDEQSITLAEKCGACLLMFATLAVGLYPKFSARSHHAGSGSDEISKMSAAREPDWGAHAGRVRCPGIYACNAIESIEST